MTDKIVMYDSPEAAHKEFREIWVSRTGRISLDENVARYDGCTHTACGKCGEPTRKSWTICDKCRTIAAVERYNAKPKKAWDGEGVVFSEVREQYYDENDLAVLEAAGECLAELMLVICDPVFANPIEDDYFCDVLPEDGEVPDEIMDAAEVFNKAMEAYGPLSWYPGPYAMDVSAYLEPEEKRRKTRITAFAEFPLLRGRAGGRKVSPLSFLPFGSLKTQEHLKMLENPFTLEEVVKLSKLVRKKREKNRSSTVLWGLEFKLFRLERDLITKTPLGDTSEDLYVVTNTSGTSALAKADCVGMVGFKSTKVLADLLTFESVKAAEDFARRSSAVPGYFLVITLSEWLASGCKG